ncbi:MAG: MFS transporter [Acidobacteria bacterium]|nr:MFS transporter [Acidobacteriota bacterium]
MTADTQVAGLFGWWRAGTPEGRRALVAGGLGWMLDSFDVMLYALVLATLMQDLDMSKQMAGILGSITLVASAIGGIVFGIVADRFGRTRALVTSILIYSVFTAACGFAQTIAHLAVFRVFLGLGLGGEWASGAGLVSETWAAEHRGKALGFMQSAWAVGYGTAALVVAVVLPIWGWRAVFFVGVLPALLTVWVQRRVDEPAIWRARQARPTATTSGLGDIFRGDLLRLTVPVTLMNACTMFAWWGFNQWIPAYLSLPAAQGGIGLSTRTMSGFIMAMQVGMWFGYVTFGFISDSIGRKRAYVIYVLTAAVLLLGYGTSKTPGFLLLLGPVVAFFATGYFTGFGAVTAEIYPTEIRATAQGFTYNIGRLASAVAPFAVGSMAATHGFGTAFTLAAAAFVLAAVMWLWIPETKGRALA